MSRPSLSAVISRAAILAVGLALGALAPVSARAEEASVVGRVRITRVDQESGGRVQTVTEGLEAGYAAAPGEGFPERRVVSVRPRAGDPTRFDVTIYDYRVQKGFDLVVDGSGNELSRRPLPSQPALTPGEVADAQAVVSGTQPWAEEIAGGAYRLYAPMPPLTIDGSGHRLVNVGVLSQSEGARRLLDNEVVSVDLTTGRIVRYLEGAPPESSASLLTCNPPPSQGCGAAVGSCASSYHVEWPAPSPVWKFDVRHPSCTTSVQGDGTGLELTNVYYQGTLVLQRAEIPVLNVLYEGNTCGPFRDWLYEEDCFQATGTDVPAAGSGIRVTTGNPTPYTFCESGSDAGNYRGVAIHDQGSSLWLLTEMQAGYYRYVMEWRLHLDGTIEPIFGFGATSNGCTCNLHYHHAYWRLEWALGGVSGDPATGIATLERLHPGSIDQYDPVTTEGKFTRPATDPGSDWWRIRNATTQTGYVLQPGAGDGQASGDAFGKGDLWALAYHSGEINDPNVDKTINIDPWVSGESLGTTKRLVTWYHATYRHDGNADPEPCELAGPKLVFSRGCEGTLGMDRTSYGCGTLVTVSVDDVDLRGAGTATVALSSTTEPVAESVSLAETPAGSGHFRGSFPTFSGAAAHGDGVLSVAQGDTIRARYVDASACGTANVTVEKTASAECSTLAVSNVRTTAVTTTGATIAWDTSEPASGKVHYGTAPPGGSVAANASLVTAHSQAISGLVPCTLYYYWIESTDGAGNTAATNSGGGYYSFRTSGSGGTGAPVVYTSTDTPVAIPELDSAGVTSTINVADSRIVQDVNVTVNITHTYDHDLNVYLITPNSTTISLAHREDLDGHNYTNTTFDDEAATSISTGTPPFTGSFRPESPLSAADLVPGTGAWGLHVVDLGIDDTGTIDSWSLALTYPGGCAAPGVPPPVPDGSFGSPLRASRANPAGSSIQLVWDAATCPAKNYHVIYGPLASVAFYPIAGAACGAGPAGSYLWTGIPQGNLWFVVVGDDGASVESSWGRKSSGVERGGTTASNQCGYSSRNNTGSCP